MTKVQLQQAQKSRGGNSRLCGDMSMLIRHVDSMKTGLKHERMCKVCGEKCYSECGLCKVPLHYVSNRGSSAGKICFFNGMTHILDYVKETVH